LIRSPKEELKTLKTLKTVDAIDSNPNFFKG